VEVIHPKKRQGIIDLADAKTKVKITKSLNPFKEGKKYLEQIEN
jgi:hypothetical protein